MSAFRTRILGLAAAAMAFAGASYGQFQCGTNFPLPVGTPLPAGTLANLLTTTALAGAPYSPTQVRSTATNDLVADLFFECGGQSSALSSGQLTVTLNAAVTSRQGTANEATLVINSNGVNSTYSGVVSGSTVTFSSVNFPAGTYSVEVANIRVSAAGIAAGAAVTESVVIGNLAQVLFSAAAIPVGFVETDFGTPTAATPAGLPIPTNTVTYPICVGFSGLSYIVSIQEKFGGAFKPAVPSGITPTGAVAAYTCGGQPCNLSNGNTGTYPFPAAPGLSAGIGTGTGQASHGTRFLVSFAGTPAGVTLYVPTSVVVNGSFGPTLIAYLTANVTGPYVPVSATATAPAPGWWAIPASGTAVYEIGFADDTIQNLTLSVPVWTVFAANFTTSPQGPATVSIVQAPDSAINTTTNDIPNFAATATPIPVEAWNLCQTTLLFPFVTTVTGFETGIALSNTSTDPGNIGGKGPLATATPGQGACYLYVYGTYANGTVYSSGQLNAPAPAGATAPYVQPTGTSNAFGLVAANVIPANISGYMIAQCNYLYGHGFAFISYLLGTPNGAVEGYIPLVIANRPQIGTNEESLGQ